ncbi:MAG: leucine-rich repeat protein [Candidatus Hodarchaeales archaeon]
MESLRATPDIEKIFLKNTWVKEIIGTEALQECRNLREIWYADEMDKIEKLEFPPTLSLPRLEGIRFVTYSHVHSHIHRLDLSFLQHCSNFRKLQLETTVCGPGDPRAGEEIESGQLILPAFSDHPFLEVINIRNNYLKAFKNQLSPPWNCPNLHTLQLIGNSIQFLDLSPLQNCPNLQILNLRENLLESLDLTPLQHCSRLQKLDLSDNYLSSLDLSPLQHCLDLREVNLAENLLQDIDLTPLENCTGLDKIYIKDNPRKIFEPDDDDWIDDEDW